MKKITFIVLLMFACIQFTFSESIYTMIPMPKTAFEKSGTFVISSGTSFITNSSPSLSTMKAINYINSIIYQKCGYTLGVSNYASAASFGNTIAIGDMSDSDLDSLYNAVKPNGEIFIKPEAYAIDITNYQIIVFGLDSNGAFNGALSLAQLFNGSKNVINIADCHIWDYPDYSDRWLYSSHNLRGVNAITNLRVILDTAVAYKMNGIMQSDFKYSILDQQPDYYFDSVSAFKSLCDRRNIEIIPAIDGIGWSSGILWKYPNLAEGLQTNAEYYIQNDTGSLIPDARVSIPNSGFENINTSGQFTGWSWYDNNYVTQDKSVKHSGNASAKCSNFDGGNCRFNQTFNCQPFRGYLLSAWVKTQNLVFDGELKLLVLGSDSANNYRTLTFTALSIPSTCEWTNIQVVFNTCNYSKILLYCGVWAAQSGTFWVDDFEIRDLGLTNILRRKGAPLHVKNKLSGAEYIEGVDFEPIIDQTLNQSHGEYGPYHNPPTFKIKSGSNIHNGDTLAISSYHPFTSVSDENGNGSVMVCPSEDTLYSILADQNQRVNDLYHPKKFFLSHDEIRNMNWDSSCLSRKTTPCNILADNINKCDSIVVSISPNSERYIWSDMVDSLHNAHDSYYLVNGDLSGDWKQIPKSLVIANWNGKASLDWFAEQGFKQITAPYYDSRSAVNIRNWRLAQIGVQGVKGMMYTTWQADYDFLKPFAYYAWGAGPAIYHKPLESSDIIGKDSALINAIIQDDPYNDSDYISQAELIIYYQNDSTIIAMSSADKINWGAKVDCGKYKGFAYRIIALDNLGLERESPRYVVGAQTSVRERLTASPMINWEVFPNPASDEYQIRLFLSKSENASVELFDIFGRTLSVYSWETCGLGENIMDFNSRELADGAYFIKISVGVESHIKLLTHKKK